MRTAEEAILPWVRKLFPNVTHLRPYEGSICTPTPAYCCLTGDENCLAMAYLDPNCLLPWILPTGSTDMPRPQWNVGTKSGRFPCDKPNQANLPKTR
jgi:hypothetical protein